MKTGILTFSAAHNFGAVLQCYGLFSTIRSLGHDVRIIDYRPEYLSAYEPTFGLRQIISRHFLSLPGRYRTYRYWRKIYDGYMSFKKSTMLLTPPVRSKEELRSVCDDFDLIVVGSDQIWNHRFNGNDDVWYGIPGSSARWVAYAASAGNIDEWKCGGIDHTSLLSRFSDISVREQELASAISDLGISDEIPVVLDPSLLADSTIWEQWRAPIEDGSYILTYQARESDDVFRIAEELRIQLGCDKIIPVDFYGNVRAHNYNTRICSPDEFISLVTNARCVVTTSFHGTAFSILLDTPFYTLRLNDGADARAENLLSGLGLSDRFIAADSSPKYTEMNTDEAKRRLSELRHYSMGYLKRAIELI